MRWRDNPPKWFKDHRWANPERVRVRQMAQEVRADYRANGEVEDVDFANHQHRHGAQWDWS